MSRARPEMSRARPVAMRPTVKRAAPQAKVSLRGWLKALPAQVRTLQSAKHLTDLCQRLPAQIGQCTVGISRWLVTLKQPIEAAWLCQTWGWAQPYAVSGDVHQRRWSIHLSTGRIPDRYNKRIGARCPRFGPWEIRARLVGRPAGPLPTLVAGASPAYSLKRYKAKVSVIEISHGQ